MDKFNRRNFLRYCLAGTAALTLPGDLFAKSVKENDKRLMPPPNHQFEMLVLGDSIVWGQGLLKEQKFFYLIKEWLQSEIFRHQRTVNEPHVEAHSGATIFPEFDVKTDFTRRYSSGETNVSNPSILFQVINAFNFYKEEGARGGAAPDKVDLILLDGGINDFSPVTMLHLKRNDAEIKAKARDFCGNGMQIVLGMLSSTFPNARIVVTGYYQLISEKTDVNVISNTISSLLGTRKFARFLNIPFYRDQRLVDELARRSAIWRDESNRYLLEAIQIVNRNSPLPGLPTGSNADNPRIVFVPAPFGADNAYAAGRNSYLWELNDKLSIEDPLFDERLKTCKLDGKKGLELKICQRASTFHPNHLGAKAYAEAIKEKLGSIIPLTGWQ
jgi:hypothetical protein